MQVMQDKCIWKNPDRKAKFKVTAVAMSLWPRAHTHQIELRLDKDKLILDLLKRSCHNQCT